MQVGNPRDSAWRAISGQEKGARPLREGRARPRTEWKQIPERIAAEAKEAEETAKKAAKNKAKQRWADNVKAHSAWASRVAELGKAGHNNKDFQSGDSFFWGILWLLYSMNQLQGKPDSAWNLRDCSWKHLIGGAVKYNGGGDPKYGARIRCTLRTRKILK